MKSLSAMYRLADYPVLATLAAPVTTATQLDGRACRYLYKQALARIDMYNVTPSEFAFMKRLGIRQFRSDCIAIIATHLNVPYGPVVQGETVVAALKSGSFKNLECSELELELLKTIFVECVPSLIGRACYQVGADLEEAHGLYVELRAEGHPVIHRWEDAMKGVVIPYDT